MYRNIATYPRQGKQYIWLSTWDEDGNRVIEEHEIKPYLYYEDMNFKESPWKSMNGKPLRKMEFNTSFDRNEWIKNSLNIPLFEKFTPEKQYLIDAYCGKERDHDFMKYALRTFFFDIEVEIDGCFPDASFAEFPINVISIYDTLTKTIYVWTYKKDIDKFLTSDKIDSIQKEINDEYEKDVKVEIRKFKDEKALLVDFLKFWEDNYPDIVSGWNIDGFDIPYIINRIKRVLPAGFETRLSPLSWNKNAIRSQEEQVLRQKTVKYHIMGVSLCDYLLIYKKFIGKSQQSFKLDYIAKKETGKGKLDYYDLGYDSMQSFMREDFATFVKYNIIDSTLVKQIDDQRHFIELMRRVCNLGLCEYENIFKTTPIVLGGLCIEARHMGVKFLTDANRSEDSKFETDGYAGAFVFPTIPGFYTNGIMSFDFNSLYPNCIITNNISPETMVGKVLTEIGDDSTEDVFIRKINNQVIKMSRQKFNELLEKKCCISAANVLFLKTDVQFGILPSFLDKLYKGRVRLKTEMKNSKKIAHDLDEQIQKLEKQLEEMEQE